MSSRILAPHTLIAGWWTHSRDFAATFRAGRRRLGAGAPPTPARLVLFTDPDTLRDEGADGWSTTERVVAALEEQGIVVVLWGNETRSAMELIQSDLRLHHPFISENGGGLFIRHGYFHDRPPAARDTHNYHVIDRGRPYHVVATALRETAREVGVAITAFSDMSIEHVAQECRLSLAQARLAKLREYDEPFRLLNWDPRAYSRICNDLRRKGMRCFTHGAFHHATTVANTAQTLRLIAALYQQAYGGPVLTIGLAKDPSETCLLRMVDIPLVMPGAGADPARFAPRAPTARFVNADGAVGLSEAILQRIEGLRGKD
jgi:mannosyl-3-phosphoglycerate phosphatase